METFEHRAFVGLVALTLALAACDGASDGALTPDTLATEDSALGVGSDTGSGHHDEDSGGMPGHDMGGVHPDMGGMHHDMAGTGGWDVAAVEDAALPDVPGGSAEPVTLTFEARVGDAPFACGTTYDGLGAGQSTFDPADFRLYVHDVDLLAGDVAVPLALVQDGKWQVHDVALLDFEDKSGGCANGTPDVSGQVRGAAPAGEYDGVRFRVGVPEELNHADVATAPSPLNLSGLYWNWTGGYKYLRIDGKTGGVASFNIHLGATMCAPEGEGGAVACARSNLVEVELRGFDPRTTPILVDYAALVADTDLDVNTPDTAMGCMSGPDDPDCDALFGRLGIDRATGRGDAASQRLFRVE